MTTPTYAEIDALLLTYIADTYRASYPDEQARIDRAVALVAAGHVIVHADGTATVTSQHKQATYHVNGACPCADERAPGDRCKHRFAKVFAKHLMRLQVLARYAMYLDPVTGEQVPGIAWPSLDCPHASTQIWYAPDEDGYATMMWTVTAAQVVLLAHLDA